MPKRKVRHALLTYIVDGRQEMAFRGTVVDLPADLVERYDALGATVPVDADLDRPGRLLDLTATATDEELINWLLGATEAEVAAAVATRSEVAPRIAAAQAHVKDLRAFQDKALEAASKVASGASAENLYGASAMLKEGEASTRPTPTGDLTDPGADDGDEDDGSDDGSPPPVSTPAVPPTAPETGVSVSDPNEKAVTESGGGGLESWPAPGADVDAPNTTAEVEAAGAAPVGPGVGAEESWPKVTSDEDAEVADAIVAGTVEDVTDFLSENPEQAQAILEAENRRATSTGKDPRSGVVRAVSAAAGHAQ